jgi:hypothetical protein
VPERIRRVHLARDLAEAGFAAVEVREKAAWEATERSMWEAAVAADAPGDPAVASLQREGTRVLGHAGHTRRVFATAVAPG